MVMVIVRLLLGEIHRLLGWLAVKTNLSGATSSMSLNRLRVLDRRINVIIMPAPVEPDAGFIFLF
jgi:hypothetical protein